MQTAEVLSELHRMGISLAPMPGGKIEARPKRALTDKARRLIRTHKPEILAALTTNSAAFYESVLGNTSTSIATLTAQQRLKAIQFGLIPTQIAEADVVFIAYRSGGAQGLMTIPAEKYDGLRVLEIFDATQ